MSLNDHKPKMQKGMSTVAARTFVQMYIRIDEKGSAVWKEGTTWANRHGNPNSVKAWTDFKSQYDMLSVMEDTVFGSDFHSSFATTLHDMGGRGYA